MRTLLLIITTIIALNVNAQIDLMGQTKAEVKRDMVIYYPEYEYLGEYEKTGELMYRVKDVLYSLHFNDAGKYYLISSLRDAIERIPLINYIRAKPGVQEVIGEEDGELHWIVPAFGKKYHYYIGSLDNPLKIFLVINIIE
jgi:phage-related holin